ncbi:hypothetical protein L484_014663 [Morus notabilis]|uniref:Uncharacterized protein n=1 Tax=Morus notabilis TaxID=981085 RepID=W9RUW4_9ROSA|nr:hypothetical protein L484_014663 [Morus notabilis]
MEMEISVDDWGRMGWAMEILVARLGRGTSEEIYLCKSIAGGSPYIPAIGGDLTSTGHTVRSRHFFFVTFYSALVIYLNTQLVPY